MKGRGPAQDATARCCLREATSWLPPQPRVATREEGQAQGHPAVPATRTLGFSVFGLGAASRPQASLNGSWFKDSLYLTTRKLRPRAESCGKRRPEGAR